MLSELRFSLCCSSLCTLKRGLSFLQQLLRDHDSFESIGLLQLLLLLFETRFCFRDSFQLSLLNSTRF